MKIGFVNLTPMDYDVNTPHERGLGGSESAMLYLAGELCNRGHRVVVFTQGGGGQVIGGVVHQNVAMLNNPKALSTLDVMVVQNTAGAGQELRHVLREDTKLIFWSQHAHDQLAVTNFLNKSEHFETYDRYVFVSHWQRENYLRTFGISPDKTTILRNAVAPAFVNLFQDPDDLWAHKQAPILAYTSTPFRGLQLMPKIFPLIKKRIPDATLRIYSSMAVYQMPKEQEQKEYQDLYQTLSHMEGVHYIGSLPQKELAQAMKDVLVWAYPNTFPETACTAALEALAAGAHVVTSALAALPETTMPFADLIAGASEEENIALLVERVSAYVDTWRAGETKVKDTLGAQVLVYNQAYNWRLRALEWERWLNLL